MPDFITQCGTSPCNLFDYLSGLSTILAIIAAGWALFHYLPDRNKAQEQRDADLKLAEEQRHEDFVRAENRRDAEFAWKKIAESRAFLDQARANPKIQSALKLTDYQRSYHQILATGEEKPITAQERDAALRTDTSQVFSRPEEYVRSAFDDLFEMLGEVSVLLDTEHVDLRVFAPTLGYYAKKLKSGPVYEAYCKAYGFERSWKLIEELAEK